MLRKNKGKMLFIFLFASIKVRSWLDIDIWHTLSFFQVEPENHAPCNWILLAIFHRLHALSWQNFYKNRNYPECVDNEKKDSGKKEEFHLLYNLLKCDKINTEIEISYFLEGRRYFYLMLGFLLQICIFQSKIFFFKSPNFH